MNFNCSFVAKAAIVLAMFVCLSVVAACKKSAVKLYPVKGKVLFKGQPAEGAQVVFRSPTDDPNKAQSSPYGDVSADGTFKLRTEPHGEGAPAGDYNVMISWYTRTDPEDPLTSKSKLPAKYSDPTKPVIKATVKEGDNDLQPFDLK